MTDDFKNAPVTMNEARALKERRASKWTLRDMLISLLREIDSGKTPNSEIAAIFWGEIDEKGGTLTKYSICGPNNYTTEGMIQAGIREILHFHETQK